MISTTDSLKRKKRTNGGVGKAPDSWRNLRAHFPDLAWGLCNQFAT